MVASLSRVKQTVSLFLPQMFRKLRPWGCPWAEHWSYIIDQKSYDALLAWEHATVNIERGKGVTRRSHPAGTQADRRVVPINTARAPTDSNNSTTASKRGHDNL